MHAAGISELVVLALGSALGEIDVEVLVRHVRVRVTVRLLLKPGTGRDKPGITRPVPPTKTRDGRLCIKHRPDQTTDHGARVRSDRA